LQDPNNRITYKLVNTDGLEQYFTVNAENGLITLARPIDKYADEQIAVGLVRSLAIETKAPNFKVQDTKVKV
jgi:hypothetical protein